MKIDILASRSDKLFEKFVLKRQCHAQILADLDDNPSWSEPTAKFETLFNKFRLSTWQQSTSND